MRRMKMKKSKLVIISILMLLPLLIVGCRGPAEQPAPAEENNNALPQYPYDEIQGEDISGIVVINDLERTPILKDPELIKEVAAILQKTKTVDAAANEELIQEQGMILYLNTEMMGSNEVNLYLSEANNHLTIGPTGKEYVIESKELIDFIERNMESDYVIVEEQGLPQHAKEWLGQFDQEKGAFVYQHPDGTYIKIIAGEKPTGGYSIEVQEYDDTDYPRKVTIDVIEPDEGDATTQALTYPTLIIKVPSDQASKYEVTTTTGEAYDVEETLIFAKLEKPEEDEEVGNPVQIKGKIIAFEGSFIVRILDEDDNIIHEEVLQADAGGPVWGSFDEEITYPETDAEKGSIELGEYSPKDGEYIQRVKTSIKLQ